MTNDIYKFPRTHHLAILGDNTDSIIRDDKVMSESERYDFLSHELVLEEKVDGANLGISFDREANILCQNRGEYLQYPFMQKALIAAILIGIICALIGSFILLRGMVFLGEAIAHSAFAGGILFSDALCKLGSAGLVYDCRDY